VVVTGIGPVSGYGVGIEPLWAAMTEGRSAIARIRRFDPAGFICRIAAELDDDAFRVRDVVPKKDRKATKVMCRDVELAVGAAAAAVADAGFVTRAVDPDAAPTVAPERLGCQIGAGLIAAELNELTAALSSSRTDDGGFDLGHWGRTGMHDLTPLWLLKYLPNMLACHVTIIHECRGPSNTITCCEASGLLSLAESVRVIQRGDADACLTGGTEHKVNPMGMLRQQFGGRLMPTDDAVDPASAGRPFAPDSTGTVLGEGGGILVVEALDVAEARGAHVKAEVLAVSATQSASLDATGLLITEDDESIADAIELVLERAGLEPSAIDAIVPLGSGIPTSDRAEARAIRAVFGARAASIPIVTTVPFTGNCIAGQAALALSTAVACLDRQRLPARLNTPEVDGLLVGAAPSTDAVLEHVLVVSTSQGGQNAATILRRAR